MTGRVGGVASGLLASLLLWASPPALAQEAGVPAAPFEAASRPAPGAARLGDDLPALLAYAREHSADLAVMHYEAEAAQARVVGAGALPDPRFQMELRDITRMGEQDPTLSPARVGSTKYLFMQDLPWFGKRELRGAAADAEARAAAGLARNGWAELSGQIRQVQIQRHFLLRNRELTESQLAVMTRLEQTARVRYANGLAPQQDAIRAQVEQSGMRNELLMLDNQSVGLDARLNALLNRPQDQGLLPAGALPPLPPPARLQYAALAERLRGGNPQLAVEGARTEAASRRQDLSLRERYPDFTVGVAPIQYGSAIRDYELMFQVNIPLQQASRRGAEHEAQAMLMAAQARQQAVLNRLQGDLGTALAGYEASARSSQLYANRLLPQVELAFRAAQAGYEQGQLDFATVLEAQRQLIATQMGQLKVQAEQYLRLAEIETLLGDTP